MTTQEFLSYLNSGKEVTAGSDIHLKMTELSNEAMRITAELNNTYHTPDEIKALIEKLTNREIGEGAVPFTREGYGVIALAGFLHFNIFAFSADAVEEGCYGFAAFCAVFKV